MKIDGEMDGREGWDGFPDGTKVEPMLVLLDGQRLATVRALYDEKLPLPGVRGQRPERPRQQGQRIADLPIRKRRLY